MRTALLCVTICAGFLFSSFNGARAQTSYPDSLTENYLLDFSVPDMPAFKALGTDPSDILRPSDIQKFAAMLSPFYSNGRGTFPKNFALEVAPWKLASKDMTLSQYRGVMRTLYNTGFSLGTIRDSSSNASKVALGMRISFVPKKADILIEGPRKIKDRQLSYTGLRTVLDLAIRKEPGGRASGAEDRIIARLNHNDTAGLGQETKDAWRAITDLIGSNLPDSMANSARLPGIFYSRIAAVVLDSLVTAWNQNLWNSNRYDLALAYVAESPDSLVSASRFSSLNLWGAAAWRAGKYGQVLFGANIKIPRSENGFRLDATINLRGYLGTKDFRGFLETQYKRQNLEGFNQSLLLNLGGELRIGRNFWLTATAGISNYLDAPKPLNALVSSIDIRYAFNRPSN